MLRVDDPITGRSVWRSIDLGESTAPAHARLLALALAELIAASWTELVRPAVPPPTTPVATSIAPEPSEELAPPTSVRVSASLARPRGLRAMLTGGALRFGEEEHSFKGAGVRLFDDGSTWLGWMADVMIHRKTYEELDQGGLHLDVFSIGAAALTRFRSGRAHLDLGVGLRGGPVRLTGTPANEMHVGRTVWSKWFGPRAVGNLAVAVTDRFEIDAALETGYVLSRVQGYVGPPMYGVPAARIEGRWLQLHVGIAVRL
jgi:hypothetical protein